jgi:hypothetical protein
MAKFLFMSNGYFVNMDLITAMRIEGQIGSLAYIEIWFTGSSTRDKASLSFKGKEANELFDELLKVHRMLGWTGGADEAPAANG